MLRFEAPTDPNRRNLLRLATSSALLPVAAKAQTQGELRVILAAETAQQASFVEALRARWPSVAAYSDAVAAASGRRWPLAYVSVGPRALQQALRVSLHAPLIALLVSRQAYGQLVAQADRRPWGVTSIFAEASPWQQMRTIAAVMRRPVTVGAFLSDHSPELEPTLKAAAETAGLLSRVQRYEPAIGISRNLLRLGTADVLLISPDSNIFDPRSLRELLESTYRRRQPVFGFSEALVAAGTLASAFASADHLAAHVVELLAAVSSGRLPTPQHPRYWGVAINESVARSLDIVIDKSARRLGDRP